MEAHESIRSGLTPLGRAREWPRELQFRPPARAVHQHFAAPESPTDLSLAFSESIFDSSSFRCSGVVVGVGGLATATVTRSNSSRKKFSESASEELSRVLLLLRWSGATRFRYARLNERRSMHSLDALRALTRLESGLFSRSFSSGCERRCYPPWKYLGLPKRIGFDVIAVRTRRSKLVVKAVATEWPERLALIDGDRQGELNGKLESSSPAIIQIEAAAEDSMEEFERENLRRTRISRSNKGKAPWNKGKKHSAETIQRIRERTKLAMQNPKVKMKLKNTGHAQSEETRMKIGARVRMGWQRRRRGLMMQKTCFYQWQNLIAEASRNGHLIGLEELQWDTYNILDRQLEQEWLASVQERKSMPRPKGSKRVPKSLEQRRKIAKAIAAKWEDPEYRNKVYSGMVKHYGTPVRAQRKSRRRKIDTLESRKMDPAEKRPDDTEIAFRSDTRVDLQQSRLRRSKMPLYKDPLVSSKLGMIKNIRAEREAMDTKAIEAVEQARVLIAQAQKAAKALEVAARTNAIARDSLLEARRMTAEAAKLIKSIETGQRLSGENETLVSDAVTEMVGKIGKGTIASSTNIPNHGWVNGSHELVSGSNENFDFSNFTWQSALGDGEILSPEGSSFGQPKWKPPMKNSHPAQQRDQMGAIGKVKCQGQAKAEKPIALRAQKVTKKWVRGRLVEVTELT
ncbi:uncharacterized protein LOC115685789 [Syzygium oleosum]|uniref:uncharacterized protein LOC115685789 n=1 Tax=Syzygium oleosum TaxID=219896 RepID=UPI0024BAD834|nr:uncharacterized protein LOC115685789 [Syzygium oleosum]